MCPICVTPLIFFFFFTVDSITDLSNAPQPLPSLCSAPMCDSLMHIYSSSSSGLNFPSGKREDYDLDILLQILMATTLSNIGTVSPGLSVTLHCCHML